VRFTRLFLAATCIAVVAACDSTPPSSEPETYTAIAFYGEPLPYRVQTVDPADVRHVLSSAWTFERDSMHAVAAVQYGDPAELVDTVRSSRAYRRVGDLRLIDIPDSGGRIDTLVVIGDTLRRIDPSEGSRWLRARGRP